MAVADHTDNAEPLSSPIFRPGAGACARVQASGIMGKCLGCIAVLLLALTIVAANFDWRWAVVGLMALFLAFPMLAFLVWLKALGNPAYAEAMKLQRWRPGMPESTLTVEFFTPDDDGEPQLSATYSDLLPERVERCGRYAVVHFATGSPFRFLIAPADLVPILIAQKFML